MNAELMLRDAAEVIPGYLAKDSAIELGTAVWSRLINKKPHES